MPTYEEWLANLVSWGVDMSSQAFSCMSSYGTGATDTTDNIYDKGTLTRD